MKITYARYLRRGYFDGELGNFYAWPIDGYYDVHWTPIGTAPDGSDVISEGHPTLADAQRHARETHEGDRRYIMSQLIGRR